MATTAAVLESILVSTDRSRRSIGRQVPPRRCRHLQPSPRTRYTEIAAESRSQHKSQGFGSAERRGTLLNYFDQLAGDPATKDIFEGIDTSWSRYPGGEKVGSILQQASDTFDPSAYTDDVRTRIEAAVQKKVEGQEITMAEAPAASAQVIDLMEALRASLEKKPPAKGREPQAETRKPPKRAQPAAPAAKKAAKR